MGTHVGHSLRRNLWTRPGGCRAVAGRGLRYPGFLSAGAKSDVQAVDPGDVLVKGFLRGGGASCKVRPSLTSLLSPFSKAAILASSTHRRVAIGRRKSA